MPWASRGDGKGIATELRTKILMGPKKASDLAFERRAKQYAGGRKGHKKIIDKFLNRLVMEKGEV